MKNLICVLTILFSCLLFQGCSSQKTLKGNMASELTLYVVRHAEAYQNLPNKNDFPKEQQDTLTDKGVAQAHASANTLVAEKIDAIYASPTGRTTLTAAIFSKELLLGAKVIQAEALVSLKNGLLPDGKQSDFHWRLDEWKSGRDSIPPGGENMESGQKRILQWLEKTQREGKYHRVVLVTHSDICAAMIGGAKGTSFAEIYEKHKVAPASVQKIIFRNHSLIIE